MQIAEASLKLNLNIFLADFKVKYCKCVVKVKLYHQACSFSGRSWNEFFKATAGIYVCLLLLYKK